MSAEGKDKPELGSIGEGLPPRVLDLALKSVAAFDGQLAGDVFDALVVHLTFLVDSREDALRVAIALQLIAKRAVERANNLPPTGGVH